MKYSRLTREQFEELHLEFSRFLATQSIPADEWNKIKSERPQLVEEQLDLFSDLVWEKVLTKANYLQNASSQRLFLFKAEDIGIRLIMIKTNNPACDLTNIDGIEWVLNNLGLDTVEVVKGEKQFVKSRNEDLFELIQQGATIVDGNIFEATVSRISI